MEYVQGTIRVPSFLRFIFKPFVIGNFWSERITDLASEAISEGILSDDFSDAEYYIWLCEKLYGVSTETVKLRTRVDRIRLLGS